jgi:cyclophilin family peptidyl-prolyl cis-trans isomerase
MRNLVIILLCCGAAIGLGVTLSNRRSLDLHPAPQNKEIEKEAEEQRKAAERQSKAPVNERFEPPRGGARKAVMSIPGKGDITFEIYPAAAPLTCKRMVELIASGFYNGIRFHRVEPGFVVQAGDPGSKTKPLSDPSLGSGGSGQAIKFEKNDLQHVRGTMGIALSAPSSDTGDSQFFINLKSNHNLDGTYCVFGYVTEGMELVDKIEKGDIISKLELK